MKKANFVFLASLLAALLAAGCGPKEEVSEPGAGPSAPAAAAKTVDPATVATVTGKVTFQGEKPRLARIMMDQDPVCVKAHSGPVFSEEGKVNDDGTVPNAFVYVKSGLDDYSFPVPSEPVELDQEGCMYKPHVLGIMAGQTLKIVTSDPTSHNIHPTPKTNREWNLSQAPGAAPLEQKFSRPEVMIPVKCNQHPWMKAYIGVVRHPVFAVTGADGTFTLKGLPPGEYVIEAWTSQWGTQEQKVTVAANESKTVDFTFKKG